MIAILDPSQFKSSEIPTNPGVYLFKGASGEILYIGKASNLRNRVKSYFQGGEHPAKTSQLVARTRSIDWIVVNNEVEALLLENKLVKQYKPKYNIDLKDAKTFAYIALTKETFPRIFTSRKISRKLETFGPYTDGFTRQDLQRLVVRVFRLRVCRKLPKRACLNFHIGLCTAPCIGRVTADRYAQQVEQARSFLSGNYNWTLASLESLMQAAAKEQKYERALELRNQIASIRLLTERQIVDNDRSLDQDVMVFSRVGETLFAVQMGVRRGVLLGKKEFSMDLQPQVEQEFLKAFYAVNVIPNEIVLNKSCWRNEAEKAALEEFLSSNRKRRVTLSVPKRGNRAALVALAVRNLESSLKQDSALLDLQVAFNLPVVPRNIECFDVSNLGQEHVVSGMVRFNDAKPDRRGYRKFKIKTFKGQDDFAAVGEVVARRYRRLLDEKASLPDLVVVDGGLGQVSSAEKALRSLGLQIPLVGLAKDEEMIYLPDDPVPKRFNATSRMMLLVRSIRDEAHRFSLGYNRKRREMKLRNEFKARY